MEYKGDNDTNFDSWTRNSLQNLERWLEDMKIGRRSRLSRLQHCEYSRRLEETCYHSDSNHIYQPLRSGRIWNKVSF